MTFIIIGFIAGILSGLFGIGGGVIIVPALVMFAGLEQKMANGVSIASLLLPVGVLGVIKYHKENYVKVKESLTIGLGLLTGTYFGAWFAMSLPSKQLKYFYAFFLLFVAYRFIKKSGVLLMKEVNNYRNN